MTPEEIEKLVTKNMKNARPDRDRVIGSRRYNLVVFRMVEGKKETIDTIEYLTRKQANELKIAYRKEDSLMCDIIEDITTDRNGNEIIFTEKADLPIVKGLGGFNSPAATRAIIERDRKKERSRSSFSRKQNPPKKSKTITYHNAWMHPASSMRKMYLAAVKRNGFTVVNKVTQQKFIGLREEVAEYVFSLLKSGNYTKNDLDIRFNGV